MRGNPFDDPMISTMYQDALQSLYAGAVMPHEREILAIAPLPTDIVDPFASQDVDPRQIMGFAYNSLVTWIDEARKANYFSKHFTDLSKLVLKGVMTMGRGLVTLHNRGEDLSQAPMQIGDLISVASYHFRKSYLGVIQTAKSHPEISERLLLNQLSWTNMLLRLYKTKDKLESGGRIQVSGIGSNEEGRSKNEELPDNKADNSSFFIHNSSLPDVAALFEPAGLSAPRALTSLDRSKGSAGSRTNASTKSAESTEQSLNRADKSTTEQTSTHKNYESKENNTLESENPEVLKNKKEENEPEEIRNTEVSYEKMETGNPEFSEAAAKQPGTETQEKETPDQPEAPREKNEDNDPETAVPDLPEKQNEQVEELVNPSERTDTEEKAENFSGQETIPEKPGSFPPAQTLIHETKPPKKNPPNPPPAERDLPFCLQIMKKVIARSEQSGDGSLTFTFDEIRYLATDPVFARIDPRTAANMRKMLRHIDSG